MSSICNPTTPCTAVYQASYDLSGNMTCRALSSAVNCGTTPTGQVMSYDNAGRMTHWQDKPTSPSHQQDLAYDGEGNRVALKLDGNITYYLGQYSEITGSTHTKYLQAGNGLPTVMSVGSGMARSLKYLMTDGLGSVTAIFDDAGHVQSQNLYAPYGGIRYSSGSSGLTSKGFTGQRVGPSSASLQPRGARIGHPTCSRRVASHARKHIATRSRRVTQAS